MKNHPITKIFSDKTVTSKHLKIDERENDIIAQSADADIYVDIYGSAVELENLRKKGSINEFFAGERIP